MMIGLAVFLDVLQFLLFFLNAVPVAGTAIAFMGDIFITALAFVIFYLVWFPLLGVGLSKGKPVKLVNAILSAVIEMLPILDILPGITYGVVSTVILSRAEDAAHNKKSAERQAQVLAQTKRNRQIALDARAEAEAIANRAANEAEREEVAQLNERDSELV
jgi:hypothetical protein